MLVMQYLWQGANYEHDMASLILTNIYEGFITNIAVIAMNILLFKCKGLV